MAKYKVSYSGFAYIEADSPEVAEEDYEFGAVYEEKQVNSVEEVEELKVMFKWTTTKN